MVKVDKDHLEKLNKNSLLLLDNFSIYMTEFQEDIQKQFSAQQKP